MNTSLKIAVRDNFNTVNLPFGSDRFEIEDITIYQLSTSNVTPNQDGEIRLTIAPGDSVYGHLAPDDEQFMNYTLNGVAIEIFVAKQTS